MFKQQKSDLGYEDPRIQDQSLSIQHIRETWDHCQISIKTHVYILTISQLVGLGSRLSLIQLFLHLDVNLVSYSLVTNSLQWNPNLYIWHEEPNNIFYSVFFDVCICRFSRRTNGCKGNSKKVGSKYCVHFLQQALSTTIRGFSTGGQHSGFHQPKRSRE